MNTMSLSSSRQLRDVPTVTETDFVLTDPALTARPSCGNPQAEYSLSPVPRPDALDAHPR
jgi:hypothetical protein